MATPKEERTVEIIVNGTKANASLKEMAAAAAVLSNQVAKIAADDPRRAELITQLQQMRQRITDTRAEVNGLVQSQEQLAAAQASTVAEQMRAIAAGQASTASLSEMKTAAGLLERQLVEMAADDPGRAALIADFQALKARMGEARQGIDQVVKSEAQLRAEEQALATAQAAQVAEQQRAIAAGKQQSASFTELKTAAGLLEKQLHDLAADDPNRAAMIADYQELRARLEAVQQQLTRTSQSSLEIVVNGQRVSASMREMREAAGQLENQLDDLAQDDPARGPLIEALREMRARIHDVQEEVAGVTETTSHMRQVMTIAFGSVVGGGIEGLIDKVVETGKSIFNTTAKFETYGIVLEKALGSESLAQKAMKDIQDMATKTPFSVDELTSSFLKFVNRGLNPSMAEMTKLGDLASSQGKSFDQLTEAVLDAGTGEFERLKEFGISASKSGDQVALSFKGVQHTVANTPEAINALIISLGDAQGVVGGMAAVAQGLEGQLSNVGDTADQVAVEWGGVLRPAFVAVLNAAGLVLGVLKALPGFLRENKTGIGLLVLALVAFNAEQLKSQALALRTLALDKLVAMGLLTKTEGTYALAMATETQTVAQAELNAVLDANPIGVVIMLLALMAFGLKQLYDRSETFRAAVNSLFRMLGPLGDQFKSLLAQLAPVVHAFEELFDSVGGGHVILEIFGKLVAVGIVVPLKLMVAQVQLTVDALAGFWDMGKRVANFFGADFKLDPNGSFDAFTKHLKSNAISIGQTLLGQDKAVAEAQAVSAQKQQAALVDQSGKLFWAMAAAAAKARMERLQNEEADLQERLAKTKEGTEQEMRLKQQLITNAASQEIEDVKKTENERRIILAEAEQKRVHLAQEFYEKQAKERAAAAKKAAEEALKIRLAEIEAEKLHQEMLAQVRHAAVVARDGADDLASEMSRIYTEGQLKRAALEAEAKKDIAQLTGSAKEKAARQLDIEKKLVADLALVEAEWRQKQGEASDKANNETYKKLEEDINRKVETEEEGAARQQAAMLVPFHASLQLQQDIEAQKYQIRQAAFKRELALIEASLGKESAAYKKVNAAMLKDQVDNDKRDLANREKATKAKQTLQKLEMSTASDVLSFGLDLLNQDADARKKHHGLYVALAAAKIIVDGAREVAQIWEYSAENPANGETFGIAGAVVGAIQTGLAVARTAVALSQVFKTDSAGGGGSYAQGGATGKGAGVATSPWGQLLVASGLAIGSDGRLRDDSGFAVAGVVHEDEYVIPKWQLQDPQVAAVTQWLEARRLRGFAEGGHTSASSGATLPVASASPVSDGEKLYAVMAQMLDANLAMVQQLGDVKQWQRDIRVQLNLRDAHAQTEALKQVEYNSAIRSKS